jgi:hypothetical protein
MRTGGNTRARHHVRITALLRSSKPCQLVAHLPRLMLSFNADGAHTRVLCTQTAGHAFTNQLESQAPWATRRVGSWEEPRLAPAQCRKV